MALIYYNNLLLLMPPKINNCCNSAGMMRKQAIVGSLLIYSLEKDCKYKLATWYRVANETKKIIKMQTIKSQLNLTYRCSVFDLASIIELRIQTNGAEEAITYGPVKFDAYLSKQLETKNNNCSFSVNIHLKANQTMPLRLRVNIHEEGTVKLYLCKDEKQIFFQLPLRSDWGGYEEIFDIQDAKLTDVCIREIESSQSFKKKLENINIIIENRNYLLMTFSNVVQRNLFLAYILKKTRDFTERQRNSELKSITNSQCKKSLMENEIDDLFKSNFLEKTPRLSEKTFNDLKQVVFTPQSNLEGEEIIRERGFTMANFGQFLNPEQNKQKIEKLSDIAEEQSELPDKTILNMNKSSPRKSIATQNEKIFEEIKRNQKDRELKWKEIIAENKGLKEENKKLRKQNEFLRKKLRRIKSNAQVKYQIPDYIRKSIKAHQENGPKSCRSKQNENSNMEREKTLQFSTSQTQQATMSKEHFSSKIRISNFSAKQAKQEFRKKLGNTISESTKTVKKFINIGVTRSHQ